MLRDRVLIKESDLVAICDEIRKNDPGAYDPMPFSEIVSGIDIACREQYREGYTNGYDDCSSEVEDILRAINEGGVE